MELNVHDKFYVKLAMKLCTSCSEDSIINFAVNEKNASPELIFCKLIASVVLRLGDRLSPGNMGRVPCFSWLKFPLSLPPLPPLFLCVIQGYLCVNFISFFVNFNGYYEYPVQ